MYCKSCGAKLSDTARFCPTCGTRCAARTREAIAGQSSTSAAPTAQQPQGTPTPARRAHAKPTAKPASVSQPANVRERQGAHRDAAQDLNRTPLHARSNVSEPVAPTTRLDSAARANASVQRSSQTAGTAAQPASTHAAPSAAKPARTRHLPRYLRGAIRLVVSLCVAFALGLALRTFVIQPYTVPSESMESTIAAGDMVLAEKLTYHTREPQAGDIVTFTVYVGNDDTVYTTEEAAQASGAYYEETTFVKRVVATAGQTVEIIDGVVYVDGEALDEEYVTGSTYAIAGSAVSFPYTVPEGEIWVMGDNRESSEDSRWFGSVSVENVTGRVVFRYWPFESFGIVE